MIRIIPLVLAVAVVVTFTLFAAHVLPASIFWLTAALAGLYLWYQKKYGAPQGRP